MNLISEQHIDSSDSIFLAIQSTVHSIPLNLISEHIDSVDSILFFKEPDTLEKQNPNNGKTL